MSRSFPPPRPGDHDLRLPLWGPYSRTYFGAARIERFAPAFRFDAFVMPQLHRRRRELPDALRPCGLIPERAAPDLSAWQCSWQLDKTVRAELRFAALPTEDGVRISCLLRNTSRFPAEVSLHLLAQMIGPPAVPTPAAADVTPVPPELPPGRGVEYDARRPREQLDPTACDGVAWAFSAGETVRFRPPPEARGKCFLRLRPARSGAWRWCELASPEYRCAEDVLIDTLAICPDGTPEFVCEPCDTLPEIRVVSPRRLDFAYPGVPGRPTYSFCADADMTFYRRYAVDDLRSFFLYKDIVQQPYFSELLRCGDGGDRALDWTQMAVRLPPHGRVERAFTVRRGAGSGGMSPEVGTLRRRFAAPCRRSCERLAAVTLTNVIFPVRLGGQAVRHFTPGRQWASLYTWDSGFIGLGLLELSPQLAADVLNAYLTAETERDNAFVLHGTPLPVQIFLLRELWNRTRDRELLRTLYPGAQRFYRYLAGRHPGSTTRNHCRQPLISTWDYFYNSGGWDDYPPQLEVHRRKWEAQVLPVIPTAILIRCARILRQLAVCAGMPEDPEYAEDIAAFSRALLDCSWDAPSGYFGYVRCNASGDPRGILRTETGENFNRGLDGVAPLVSGGFPAEICSRLWEHVESERELFTPYGISTVDQSASYFREDGYWNGAVWMPHQWFLWKAALDAGKGDFAWKIAETALKVYDRECERSGYCFEHFSARDGWGGGWHHFSGLSTPVLCWHEAYFGRERFTCGFDTAVVGVRRRPDRVEVELIQSGEPGGVAAVLMTGDFRCVRYDGAELPVVRRGNASEARIPRGTSGTLMWIK